MYIWSGGGVDYATRWRDKLGLTAIVVEKGSFTPDIAFDDEDPIAQTAILSKYVQDYVEKIIKEVKCDLNCSDFGNLEGEWCDVEDIREKLDKDFKIKD
jgi:hypothetical protein